MPGHTLLALARRVLSHTEIDRTIEPAIADLQHECEAAARLSLPAQLFVRARAYLGALRVVGTRLIAAGSRATMAPPPWPLLSRAACMSLIQVVVSASAFTALDSGRAGEHWPFYLTDHVTRFLPMAPLLWTSLHGRGPLGGPALILRWRDLAKLTFAAAIVCLLWSGWVAPLLRQQYLVAHGLSEYSRAAVHQWTSDQLIAVLDDGGGTSASAIATELQRRATEVGLLLLFGVCAWLELKASNLWSKVAAVSLGLSGPIVCVGLLGLSAFLVPQRTERLLWLEWATLLAGLAIALGGLRLVASVERSRRPELEAKALSLLLALPNDRQAELMRRART